MTTPFPFTAGQVLTAAQMNDITNLPINDQTASYTLVVGDAGKRVVMNVATANTVTVNDSVFTTGDTIFVANKGAGASTLTAGAGVTINTAGSLVIAQHGGGTLVATSASVFTFFSGNALNATPSTVDHLVVGGGGGGQSGIDLVRFGAGAGGGGQSSGTFAPTANIVYTLTVGGGGASNTNGVNSTIAGTGLTTITGGGGNTPVSNGIGGTGGTGTSTGGAGGNGGATGSAGANGTANSITGVSVSRGPGGGGSRSGAGGATGGGVGGNNAPGGAATANTGGGGGGGEPIGNTAGGAGGSGIIIVKQLRSVSNLLATVTVGTATVSATEYLYTFNASGTLEWQIA